MVTVAEAVAVGSFSFCCRQFGSASCDTLLLLSRSYFDKDASHGPLTQSLSLQFDYCCNIFFCCVLKSRTRDLI